METVKAFFNQGEVVACQFDGKKESVNLLANSGYFKGSVTYDGDNIREFSFFDVFSKKYNSVHEGDWFVLCNSPEHGKGTIYIHLKPMAFHTLFTYAVAKGPANTEPSPGPSQSDLDRAVIVATADRLYADARPGIKQPAPASVYDQIKYLFYEWADGKYSPVSLGLTDRHHSELFYNYCKSKQIAIPTE